ncbi:sensor histidine kinase [Clostridium transplantifaecale]|uniref:sensor histidine kinase n=1 Tax=Clostridium transplantifaecale TaxID=2479838 RepID=UPI000F63012B|nr:ATP-binding protein [Clostridium transplantifaecale]
MRKAIFIKFIQLLFVALALNTFIFYVVTSSVLLKKTRSNMMFALETVDNLFDYSEDLTKQTEKLKTVADANQSRFTVVKRDGSVEVDTEISNAAAMENHMEREEVKEALRYGSGHSIRKSETLGAQMLYVARMSADGEYILRLASPYSGMQEYLLMLLPAVLLSFAIAFIVSTMEAERFSQSITKPLKDISKEMLKVDGDYADFHFERCPYQEINVIADTTTKMSQNVKKYLERLEQEKQIRQEFFSNASHELKTPITSIRGYVELLESGMSLNEETTQDFMKRIKKEAMRMASLVDDILMISRLESRGAKTDIIKIQAAELLEEAIASLATQAAERNVFIHKRLNSFTIRADLRQMTELCMNLIGNAVKYNNPGGEVWVEVRRENTDMVLIVKDSGVGIPSESLNRIFERFYRVDKGRSRKQGGTGLGLAIVKHVVNFYHGTVRVESEIGKGSTFTVRLPIAEDTR